MCQPLKQCSRTATVAWCPAEAAPSLMALGSSANSVASVITSDGAAPSTLDFVSFDLGRPGTEMDILASIRVDEGRRFSSISWGSLGVDTGMYPYGILAGGLQEGVISLWNPYAVVHSRGADPGLVHSIQVHKGTVNCVEFHPAKSNLMATAGADSEVNILNIDKPTQPDLYKPSATSKHQGSEVLCCAWNRKVQHILCSCSNTGTTVVWDLKQKKEVISFQDPANRQRCSGVAWHPEVPTQLLVAYDDDRQPSMQMWDLRNCTYPFKETAGHTKGILSVAWNTMDPNLILSCGKDNRLICWNNSSGTLEPFSEIASQHGNFEVKWAPHKPSIISAASFGGSVSVHSVQQQQHAGVKYCPRWYKKPCGVSFGFGGKMLSFGLKKAATPAGDAARVAMGSWCHSLVVPNEPEIIPTADLFEQWIAEQRLREYCHDKTTRSGGTTSHEGLMWELMGCQFEDGGRQRVPSLLGFDNDRILQEAERFLGKRPGTTLMEPAPEPASQAQDQSIGNGPPPSVLGPELDLTQAESFFEELSATTEQRKKEEMEREHQKQLQEAQGIALSSLALDSAKSTDWSVGPEALIKQSLLVGNLTAAVEICFKSGRMAEALLLASGGGTTLWTRARDEYLRLQGDSFLSTVGNIMTNDFEKLVASSNLANWMETLAIMATYSGEQYKALCEQLAERLEKEKFDIRSAVICYICAKNFPKTVSIWANTHVASQGSQKLALQDLVEKMAVLQEATKFSQADSLFNAKLTQYAEILANSGRLTAAMRYLCLLRDDASSAILRDRIYNSAPMQMSQLFGRPPSFPFETTDVRIVYQPPAQQQYSQVHAGVAGHGVPHAKAPGPAHGPLPGGPPTPAMPSGLGHRPGYPGVPTAPQPAPGVGHFGMGGSVGYPGPAAPAPSLAPAPAPGPGMGPAPRINPSAPSGLGGLPGSGVSGMGLGHGMGPGAASSPVSGPGFGGPAAQGGNFGAPMPGPGVLPPGQASVAYPSPSHAAPAAPAKSTAPQASAMPVVDGMPVAWPLPTKTQQKLSTTSSVAAANQAVQEMSAGGSATIVGDPMPPHEMTHVKNVLSMLLDASAQDGNTKKRDDIAKRLDELYVRLQSGQIKTVASQKVLQMVKAVEAQDYDKANKLQQELCACDWEQNKNWLMGVKRLIPVR